MRKQSKYGLPLVEPRDVCRPRFRHANPIQTGVGEEVTEPLRDYSSTAANQATTVQTLYSIPIGQNYTPIGGTTFAKTRYHTNLKQAGQLPNPDKFIIQAMSVQLHPTTTPNDVNRFISQELITLTIGDSDKRYIELQPMFIGGGGGSFISGVYAATALLAYASSNGWPHAKNVYVIGETEGDGAQSILQGQNFQVVEDPTLYEAGAFTTDAAAATPAGVGLRVFYELWGQRTRGVQ